MASFWKISNSKGNSIAISGIFSLKFVTGLVVSSNTAHSLVLARFFDTVLLIFSTGASFGNISSSSGKVTSLFFVSLADRTYSDSKTPKKYFFKPNYT